MGINRSGGPDPGGFMCNGISRVGQWYSGAPATWSNVIPTVNGRLKKNKNIRILSYLIIISYFCFFCSSACGNAWTLKMLKQSSNILIALTGIFSKVIVRTSCQECSVFLFCLTQLLDFVVLHSWVSDYFVLVVVFEGEVIGAFACQWKNSWQSDVVWEWGR